MIKIPSWSFHRARMKSKGEDANNILKLLDGTIFPLHMRYRALTHKPELAPKLALALSLNAKNAGWFEIWSDIVNHIEDDKVFNKFFYQKKKEDEEERV